MVYKFIHQYKMYTIGSILVCMVNTVMLHYVMSYSSTDITNGLIILYI